MRRENNAIHRKLEGGRNNAFEMKTSVYFDNTKYGWIFTKT